MTRWEALTAICGHLRAGLLGGEREGERDVPWELMIEVASFHYVTPALARSLGAEVNVPPDVRDYFDSMAALNRQRTETMLAGLARVAGLLNAVDIEPMLLKGASLLAEGIYRDPSLRFLGDVDILIPASRAAEADAALKAAGFTVKPSDVVLPPAHHHLPMLYDPETGVGVELHTDVMSPAPDAVISTAWFGELARPARFRGQRVRLPEPTRNAGHTIFHSEIFHGLYLLNKIQLRHLLDLAVLRARHESAIDWGELDRRFSAAGFGEVLATYLEFADALFGQKAPKLSHAPRKDAMAELRRTESRDSFHSQIERLTAYQDTLQTELSHMTAARDRFRSQAARLEGDLVRAAAARDNLTEAVDRMRAERDHARIEAGRLERELGIAMRANAKLTGDISRLTGDISRLQASRSWRLTRPLRRLVAAARQWSRPRQ